MKNNKYLSYALGILFSFCLIVTLLITSVEAVTYWTPAIMNGNTRNTT